MMTESVPVEMLFFFFQSLTNRGQRPHSRVDSELVCFFPTSLQGNGEQEKQL